MVQDDSKIVLLHFGEHLGEVLTGGGDVVEYDLDNLDQILKAGGRRNDDLHGFLKLLL